jgi:hypothetical protein
MAGASAKLSALVTQTRSLDGPVAPVEFAFTTRPAGFSNEQADANDYVPL